MAYVVARRNGRFEIRESVHTPDGPRARTLAGFGVLNDDVLAKAAARATRPFDAATVTASARRTGAPVKRGTGRAAARKDFIGASRRAGTLMGRPPVRASGLQDPGAVLIDLLGFAEAVAASQPPRRSRPLKFPSLVKLTREHSRRRTTGVGSS